MPLKSAQICGHCLRSPPKQDHSFSLFRYQGSVRRCITGLKFHQQLALAGLFAKLMASQLEQRQRLPDCLLPIPLHAFRLRQRGFNQSHEVGRILSQLLGVDYRPALLKRIKATRPQTELKFKQRKHNLSGAFHCPVSKVPAHIALIDDVMTSGHTSAEASRILRQHGAETIEVWTIARVISHY